MSLPASLTIVLPAFDEEARIGPALDELFGYLRRGGERAREGAPGSAGLPERIEVLVVDDGSTDATAALVSARPEAQVPDRGVMDRDCACCRWPHGGKGAAVRSGMLAATSDLVVFADADMATPPDQLPLMIAALHDHDVALGSRIQPDGHDMRATQPAYRRLLGRVFHVLASLWVVGPVQDTQCGFKGFTRAAAQDLFARQRITSIVFDVELIYLARRRGYRMAIVPSNGTIAAARGCGRGPGWPSGSHGTCSGSPRSTGGVDGAPADRHDVRERRLPDPGRVGRAALPIVAILVFVGVIAAALAVAGRDARVRLPRVRLGRTTAPRRRSAVHDRLCDRRPIRSLPVSADRRSCSSCHWRWYPTKTAVLVWTALMVAVVRPRRRWCCRWRGRSAGGSCSWRACRGRSCSR